MNSKIAMIVGLTIIMSYTQLVSAKDQSRDDFLESMKPDLLKPCSDSAFMKCVDSNESECIVRINHLIQDCKINLPVVMTDINRDKSADKFSVCFNKGIIKKFSISEQKYNSCLVQKPN